MEIPLSAVLDRNILDSQFVFKRPFIIFGYQISKEPSVQPKGSNSQHDAEYFQNQRHFFSENMEENFNDVANPTIPTNL